MKVILLKDINKLGKKGDVISVSDGYGANYLIPNGLAVLSTAASQVSLAKQQVSEQTRQSDLKKEAEDLAERLGSINVEFTAKVGGDGRMFGSISPKQIEQGLKDQWGIVIDKRKFIDKYPANALGYTRLKIALYKGSEGQVVGTVNVHISEEK